jgi:hypothetical protein
MVTFDLAPDIVEELYANVRLAAGNGDEQAAAWLRGEGYINLFSPRGGGFVYFDKGTRDCHNGRQWRKCVLERDRYRCVNCGETNNLHAHHIVEWSKSKKRRYDTDNGVTLCRSCHAKEHTDLPFTRKWLSKDAS